MAAFHQSLLHDEAEPNAARRRPSTASLVVTITTTATLAALAMACVCLFAGEAPSRPIGQRLVSSSNNNNNKDSLFLKSLQAVELPASAAPSASTSATSRDRAKFWRFAGASVSKAKLAAAANARNLSGLFHFSPLQLATSPSALAASDLNSDPTSDSDDVGCEPLHFKSLAEGLAFAICYLDILAVAEAVESDFGEPSPSPSGSGSGLGRQAAAMASFFGAWKPDFIDDGPDQEAFGLVDRTDLGIMTFATLLFDIAQEGNLVAIGDEEDQNEGWELHAAQSPQLSINVAVLTDDLGRLARVSALSERFGEPRTAISMECSKRCSADELSYDCSTF